LPSDALLRALARVLRPLVRLLIRTGVTFPVLADLLRTVYVEVAVSDLDAGERPRTDSRVSLLTGIHRKELRRQRAHADDPEPPVITLNSQLIARWLGDPAYAEPDGTPRKLPRTGPAPSFESLVASVTRDVRSRAVLDEWLAQGTVVLGEDQLVALQSPAFLPRQDVEARLHYFARNLGDHLAAAAANVTASGPAPFIERSVHYDGLGLDAASALERAAREAAGAVLLDVNRVALAIADEDDRAASAPRPTRRVNFGVYVYVEDEKRAD
jgi:hypothetical protein